MKVMELIKLLNFRRLFNTECNTFYYVYIKMEVLNAYCTE